MSSGITHQFTWDPRKAKRNIQKHKISFGEASAVFKDPLAITVFDDSHSDYEEERWATIGQIQGQLLVVVVHQVLADDGSTIHLHLISARPATSHERRQYEEGDS